MFDHRQPVRFILLLLLLACPAYAQRDRDSYVSGVSIEIAGQVKLPENGPQARNITVRLERFSGGILDQMAADGAGKFRFSNLQRGYYTVVVSAPGYKQVQQQVDLQVVTRNYVVFELVPDKKEDGSTPAGAAVVDARVPGDAQSEFTKGRAALLDKKLKDALQHLSKAVQLYPDFFEAHFLLGTAYMDALRWAEAEGALNRARELKPESLSVLISLGEAYRRQKLYADAVKVLQDALKLEDDSWQAHFALARVYWEQGEILKAAPHVGRTLQLKPDYPDAHLLAGNVFVRLNLPERALTEYEEYLRLSPKGEMAEQTRQLAQKIRKALAAKQK